MQVCILQPRSTAQVYCSAGPQKVLYSRDLLGTLCVVCVGVWVCLLFDLHPAMIGRVCLPFDLHPAMRGCVCLLFNLNPAMRGGVCLLFDLHPAITGCMCLLPDLHPAIRGYVCFPFDLHPAIRGCVCLLSDLHPAMKGRVCLPFDLHPAMRGCVCALFGEQSTIKDLAQWTMARESSLRASDCKAAGRAVPVTVTHINSQSTIELGITHQARLPNCH